MSIGSVCLGWWSSLRPDDGRRGDPGALARLRRASLTDALMEEATVALVRALRPEVRLPGVVLFERAALLACVLPHVREHTGGTVAAACGAPKGDRRFVSEIRLRQLFAARRPEEAHEGFRRLVALLGNVVNVPDLAESLMDWTDEVWGDRRRIRWAYAYYGAAAAALSSEMHDVQVGKEIPKSGDQSSESPPHTRG